MSRDVTTSFGCDYILQQVAAGQIARAGMVAVSVSSIRIFVQLHVLRCYSKLWLQLHPSAVVTGGSLEESKEALAIAETGATLFCTVGVHPTRCKEFEGSGDPEKHLQDLLTLTKEGKEKGKVVAIEFYIWRSHIPVVLNRFVAGVAHSFTGCAEDSDKLLSFSNVFVGVNGCSLKTVENLEVVKGIPVERMMTEMDSSYCDIKNTHAGIRYVKSSWPSKKKDKHDQECLVKGRNEP
ncbi:hypothetical protein P3S68_014983 [Capsicum galapagoense]